MKFNLPLKNTVKRHLLQKELLTLEYKIKRHYALSARKAELETKRSNLFTRTWNQYQYNHVIPEYEYLSEKMPMIQSRIEEINEELKN